MKKIKFTLLLLACLAPSLTYADGHGIATSSAAHAAQSQQVNSDLLIENARAKSTIPGVKVSAGYLKLTNNSQRTMHFIAAQTPAAKYTEFHRIVMRDNKMAMRKVDSIEIKAQQSFEFTENGYHLMFMGLKQALKSGESITVTLTEDNGQTYQIILPIVAMKSY